MKKFLKSRLFLFMLGLIIAGSIGVYATIKIGASEIGYKDGTVEDALNNLYTLAGNVNLTEYAELQSSYVSNAGSTSVTFNDVQKGDYILLTVRTTESKNSGSETGFFNSVPSAMTVSIDLNGTYSEIDEDTLYKISVNSISNVSITSSTSFESNVAGGYLYARLYKIN